MVKSKKTIVPMLLVLAAYLVSVNSECYQAPSYEVTKEKYSCRLHQKNWASETYFKITYKHCLEEPTVNVFIRNFHGIDEINIDFDKRFASWKTQLFNGRTSVLILKFKIYKADKFTARSFLQVQLIYVPIFGRLDTQQLLIASFPADDKSDCIWAETLPLHEQIFLGGGLCIGFILIIVAVFCYRKYKSRQYRPTPAAKVYL